MRLKLDENLGRSAAAPLIVAGHDVATVAAQGMSGATDEGLFRACADEQRVLVTLDLDVATPLRLDPVGAGGIAVLRVPDLPGPPSILACVRRLAAQPDAADIAGRPWIVDLERVRQREPAEQPEPGTHPSSRRRRSLSRAKRKQDDRGMDADLRRAPLVREPLGRYLHLNTGVRIGDSPDAPVLVAG